jgi:hypothetical protein
MILSLTVNSLPKAVTKKEGPKNFPAAPFFGTSYFDPASVTILKALPAIRASLCADEKAATN